MHVGPPRQARVGHLGGDEGAGRLGAARSRASRPACAEDAEGLPLTLGAAAGSRGRPGPEGEESGIGRRDRLERSQPAVSSPVRSAWSTNGDRRQTRGQPHIGAALDRTPASSSAGYQRVVSSQTQRTGDAVSLSRTKSASASTGTEMTSTGARRRRPRGPRRRSPRRSRRTGSPCSVAERTDGSAISTDHRTVPSRHSTSRRSGGTVAAPTTGRRHGRPARRVRTCTPRRSRSACPAAGEPVPARSGAGPLRYCSCSGTGAGGQDQQIHRRPAPGSPQRRERRDRRGDGDSCSAGSGTSAETFSPGRHTKAAPRRSRPGPPRIGPPVLRLLLLQWCPRP